MVNITHRVQVVFQQTGAENIGRGLQSISTYGQQANQALTQSNTQLTQFTAKTASAQSGISIFGKNMQGLGAGTVTTNQQLSIFNQGLTTTQGGLTTSNTLLATQSQQQLTLGQRVKDTAGRYSTFAIGLSTTLQGVTGLARGFRDLNDMQINVDRQTRKVSLANEAVEKTTRAVTKAIKEHGTGSVEHANALRDQTQALQMQSVQTRQLEEVQEAFADFQMNVAMQTIPIVIGAIGTLSSAFFQAGLKVSHLTGLVGKLGAALKGVSFLGISGSAGIAGGLTGGFLILQQAFDVQKKMAESGLFADPLKDYNKNLQQTEIFMKATGAAGIDLFTNFDNLLKKFKETNPVLDSTGQIIVNVGNEMQGVTPQVKSMTDIWLQWIVGLIQAGKPLDDVIAAMQMHNLTATQMTDIIHQADIQVFNLGQTYAKSGDIVSTTSSEFDRSNVVIDRSNKVVNDLRLAWLRMHVPLKSIPTAIHDIDRGIADGIIKFSKFREETDFNIASAQSFRQELINWATNEAHLGDVTALTTEELKLLFNVVNKDTEAIKQITKAWQDFGKEFSKASELKAAIGVEGPDPEDLLKDFFKRLEKPQRRKLKLDLKIEQAGQTLDEQFQNILEGVLEATEQGEIIWDPNLKVDDEAANDYAKALMGTIDDAFGGKKNVTGEWAQLRESIKNSIAGPDTADKLLALLKSKVEGMPNVTIPIIPKLAGFNTGGKRGPSDSPEGLAKIMGLDKPIVLPKPDTKNISASFETVTKDAKSMEADVVANFEAMDNAVTKMWAPHVKSASSSVKKQLNSDFSEIEDSAGFATDAIDETREALEAVDGMKVKATVEVEFKATGDQIAIDKAKGGGQYGQMFISNTASIWKGKRISEFNKPELNITIPLTNPSSIGGDQRMIAPSVPRMGAMNLGGLGGVGAGGNVYNTIQLRIDGNDIVRSKDIFASIAPQMGRNMARYGSGGG